MSRSHSLCGLLGLVLVMACGCSAELEVPSGSRIQCASDDECPGGLVCDLTASRCVARESAAPLVAVRQVGDGASRPLDTVALALATSDKNAAPNGDDLLTLRLEFATDCGQTGAFSEWRAAAPAAGSVLSGLSPGEMTLRWDALADAASGAGGLRVARPDTTGDGVGDRDVVAWCPAVKLRAAATDSTGLSSGWAESAVFPLGNDPPVVTSLAVRDGAARGNAVVDLAVQDGARDAVDVFSLALSVTGNPEDAVPLALDAQSFPLGGLDGLATGAASGAQSVLLWASHLPVAMDVEEASLVIRVRDAYGAVSAPKVSDAAFVIDNVDSPPLLTVTSVNGVPSEDFTGADDEDVTVCFGLSDADRDTPSVTVEVVVCPQEQPCGEPDIADIGSALLALDLDTEHCTTWRRSQAGIGLSQVTLLLTPTDRVSGRTVGVGPFTLDTRPKSPPRFVRARAVAGPASGRSLVHLAYRLVDEASDPVDVALEFSLDGGASWRPCEEYPVAASEGLYGLASAPAGDFGDGGVDHLFAWDATGLLADPRPPLVRFTARDARFDGATRTLVSLPTPLGGEGFPLPVSYAAGDAPWSLESADLDADGILDLVVANFSSDTVSVFRGRGSGRVGDGTFAPAVGYPAGDGPGGLAIADFDVDGIPDLAVASQDANRVSVLLGVGDGTFGAAVSYAAGYRPTDLVAGDFDGDGYADLAVLNLYSNDVSVLLGNGSGTFTCPDVEPADSYCDRRFGVGRSPSGLAAGDLDGDGILDLVTANTGSEDVSVLRGNGDGTFAAAANYAVGTKPKSVSVGDLNSDGIPDLVVSASGNGLAADPGSVDVLLGEGTNGAGRGTFAAAVSHPVGLGPFATALGDFNGDGLIDVASADRYSSSQSPSTITVLLGQGSGAVASGVLASGRQLASAGAPTDIVARDFNADGVLDLATADFLGDGISVRLGRGACTVEEDEERRLLSEATVLPAASMSVAAAAADLDSDGILDLAVAGDTTAGEVAVLRGNNEGGVGGGAFEPPVRFTANREPKDLAVGDFTGDGILDLAVPNEEYNYVTLLAGVGEGVGTGRFTPAGTYGVGALPEAIVAGDFNEDGVADLATINNSSNSVSVLLATGGDGVAQPAFAAAANYGVGQSPRGIAAGDLNEDGILDLVVANFLSNSVSVLPGKGTGGVGDGSFEAARHYTTHTFPFGVAVCDFNSDGILDLAVASSGADAVSVMLGHGTDGVGDGSFPNRVSYPAGATPYSVACGDFTGDGVVDLAVVDRGGTAGLVLLVGEGVGGVGRGTFAAATRYPLGDSPFGLTVADLNADGLLDVVASVSGANAVSVFAGRYGAASSWRAELAVASESRSGTRAAALGFDPLSAGLLDLFGRPVRRDAVGHHLARVIGSPSPGAGRPLTAPYQLEGDVSLARERTPGAGLGGHRLRVKERLGERVGVDGVRQGLDLGAAEFAAQRGVLVELPILAGRTDAEIAGAGEVKVLLTTTDWRRADELPCAGSLPPAELSECSGTPVGCDPFSGDAGAGDSLPRVATCVYDELRGVSIVRYRDVVEPRRTTVAIPRDADGDLTTGTGPRFVVESGGGPAGRRVKVLLDRLGLVQAYLVP